MFWVIELDLLIMKFPVIILLTTLPLLSFAQVSTNVEWTRQTSMPAAEVIYYDVADKLEWNDFMCKPPADNSRVAAITMSGFGYSASMSSKGSKGQLNVKVYCFFNKKRSWVKPGKTTAYILTHEQHHFDISYIAACIFIDKIQGTVITTGNYNQVLSRIYDECIDTMNKMQDDYDGQTKNGLEKAIQEKWNKSIDDKIAAITK